MYEFDRLVNCKLRGIPRVFFDFCFSRVHVSNAKSKNAKKRKEKRQSPPIVRGYALYDMGKKKIIIINDVVRTCIRTTAAVSGN